MKKGIGKKILLGVVVVLAIFLGYVAMQPGEYAVAREVTINASPEAIFPHVSEPKKMNVWNPWAEMDPTAKFSYAGPESGVGAKTIWEDGKQMGTGSATVIEQVPNASVKTRLEFKKPNEMVQDAIITLTPNGTQTTVRWAVSGHNSFMGRIFCTLFMNMEKMISETFDKGLAKLKTIVETPAN